MIIPDNLKPYAIVLKPSLNGSFHIDVDVVKTDGEYGDFEGNKIKPHSIYFYTPGTQAKTVRVQQWERGKSGSYYGQHEIPARPPILKKTPEKSFVLVEEQNDMPLTDYDKKKVLHDVVIQSILVHSTSLAKQALGYGFMPPVGENIDFESEANRVGEEEFYIRLFERRTKNAQVAIYEKEPPINGVPKVKEDKKKVEVEKRYKVVSNIDGEVRVRILSPKEEESDTRNNAYYKMVGRKFRKEEERHLIEEVELASKSTDKSADNDNTDSKSYSTCSDLIKKEQREKNLRKRADQNIALRCSRDPVFARRSLARQQTAWAIKDKRNKIRNEGRD